MIVALTIVMVLTMIGFAIWLTRDNWFRGRTSGGGNYAPPTTPTLQPQQSQQQTTRAPQQPTTATPATTGSFWKLALRWSVVIAVLLAVYGAYRRFPPSNSNTVSGIVSNTTNILPNGIPIDAAVFAVSQCESGGQHFEADKKTPLKNKEGSSASGEYQFIEAHRKVAEGLGFNLDTEDGQDGYARYRILRFGLKDWQVDPRSKACIEEKLANMGFKEGLGSPVASSLSVPTDFVIIAPAGEWSQPLFLSRGFILETDWVSGKKEKHQIEYTTDAGVVTVKEISADNNETITIPGPTRKIRVKSLEEKPVAIKITLRPKVTGGSAFIRASPSFYPIMEIRVSKNKASI